MTVYHICACMKDTTVNLKTLKRFCMPDIKYKINILYQS